MSAGDLLGHEESRDQVFNELISNLPKEKGWFDEIYGYQGFWFAPKHLDALMSIPKNFHARDSDIFLASYPKSGTTWLKAIMFTLLNREGHPVSNKNHPLLARNPHDIVPFFERPLDYDNRTLDMDDLPSPRFFGTHLPYSFLPESVRNNPMCKVVCVGRNPKDTFISLWYFSNKIRAQKTSPTSDEEREPSSIEEMFEKFCKGNSPYGPIWDHMLEYWEESKKNPDRVCFLKYEEMSENSTFLLWRLAEFLNCPFSAEEEKEGVIDKILKLCSFENLSPLDVNKSGKREYDIQKNNIFFRKGSVGDYKNHLSTEMIEKLDQIIGEKYFGSGLAF